MSQVQQTEPVTEVLVPLEGVSEAVQGRTPWQLFWTRFKRDRIAVGAAVVVLLLISLAILGPVFSKYELDVYVDSYVHSFEHAVEKPSPALFSAACQALRTPARATLMVGDSHLADGGAVLAGMPTLLLPAVAPGEPRGLDVVLRLVR